MNILMIGDVISKVGCDYVREKLPNLKKELNIDVVIANGENSAIGNGILPNSADSLFDSGIDVITTGNHVFKRFEIYQYFDQNQALIRPLNYPESSPGKGFYIYDGGNFQLCVVNLMGTSFLEPLDCPFKTMNKLLKEIDCKNIIVDFHAEATGEKKALAYYLAGKVSAVVGTHTHTQTADEQILENQTAFISDVGMTGPIRSVLGVAPENIIKKLTTHMPVRFEIPNSQCQMDCVLIEIDKNTGKANSIKRMRI
ncbi:MAG: TIGR00282 family metallophosphoesterase [Oscillospiraceae bacterium]